MGKSSLEIKKIRITASNAVLIEPKHPRDCCSLLKAGAFLPNSPLGANVTARLPRENTVTHQVIIKGLDAEITDEEIKEMLDRQELPHNGTKRIFSRQRGCATEMVRLFLKSEEKKKHLLRHGIFLDQMHFNCVAAKEDVEKKMTFQCYKCQVWVITKLGSVRTRQNACFVEALVKRTTAQKQKKEPGVAIVEENTLHGRQLVQATKRQ